MAPVAAAVVLYWPSLELPLIYDTLLHIRIADDLNLTTVWLPTDDFGFYRPLTFLPLLIVKGALGWFPGGLLHGLNIAQHALNGALLSWLSWRIWRNTGWALAAGLLLVTYPFSYQAIAVYGHNVHPTTLGILLLALHAYLTGVRRAPHAARWWLLTGMLFVLGLLSHESAVLLGPLAAALHWNLEQDNSASTFAERLRQPWLLLVLGGLAYVVAYQFLPLTRSPQASFTPQAYEAKLLYTLQAVAHPLDWIGNLGLRANTIVIILASAGVLLLLTLWGLSRAGLSKPLLFGWAWWGMACAILVILLPAGYLLHGPRLLYLASAGVALLWPALLEPIVRLRMVGRIIWAVILLFVLGTGVLFVRGRLLAYDRLTGPVDLIRHVMADRDPAEGVLLINLPQWLAPEQNAYPVGIEIVAMLGDYLFAEELAWENLGVARPVRAARVPDLLDQRRYTYGVHEQSAETGLDDGWDAAGSHVFIVSYEEEGPVTHYAGFFRQYEGGGTPVAYAGPYQLMAIEALRCQGVVTVTSRWRALLGAPTPGPTTSLFVQLQDSGGRLVGQIDGPPLQLRPDLLPLAAAWEYLDIRHAVAGLEQEVLLGAYDYANGRRYPAFGAHWQSLPDNAVRVDIADCSVSPRALSVPES